MEEQFNLFEGRKLRDLGMDTAADNNSTALSVARKLAIKVASSRADRECTIDDVQRILIPTDIRLGMAAGSVFKGRQWVFTGRYAQTERKTSHARQVKIWRLL